MLVGKIPEQTGPDVEQKLKTMSGGEFDVPGGVLRGAGSRGPQFPPPQRFATFALRLGPFAWEFCDGAPVCGENDAFPERKGDLNFGNEHRSAAKTMPGFGDAGTCAEIIVSLQTGAPLRKFRSPFRSGKLGAYCRLSISNDSGLQTVTVKRFWIADLHTQAILDCRPSHSSDSGLQTITLKRFWIADRHTQAMLMVESMTI